MYYLSGLKGKENIFQAYVFHVLHFHLYLLPGNRDSFGSLKCIFIRAREMAQWSGPLSALPEDSGSIPSTHKEAHNHFQLQFKELEPFSSPHSTRLKSSAYTSMHAKTCTYRINFLKIKKKTLTRNIVHSTFSLLGI